ncbi:MAG: hypothetical protein ACYCWW_12010 [Deltaproteobacteria bacterium]
MKLGVALALLSVFLPAAALAVTKEAGPAAGGGDGVAQASDPVLPDTAAEAEISPPEKPGLGGNFIFDNSLGNGVFAQNPYVNNPAWSTNLYLRPDYSFKVFGHSLKLQAWENFYYYTVLDKNANDPRQVDWSDLRLTLSDGKIYEEPHTHIKIGGMIRAVAPLSYASRFDSMVTSIWAGVTVSKSLFGVDLTGGVLGAKNFFRYTTVQFPCSASTAEPVSVAPGEAPIGSSLNTITNGNCRSGDQSSANSTPADNVSWDLVPWFSAQYNFNDKWNFSATVYYFDQFAYAMPIDGSSPPITDSNGNAVAQAQGRSDSLWTIASLQYNLSDHYALGAGLWDTAAPKYNSNQGFRPWFFDPALNANYTTIYFDVIATY